MRILSPLWLAVISVVSNSSAVLTGTATFLAYGLATTTFPPITVGGYDYYVATILISMSIPFAIVYMVSQVLDAATPQPAPWLNRIGFITSLYAFVMISLALVLAIWRENLTSVSDAVRVLQSPSAFWTLIGLFAFSLFDLTVLQRIKNTSVDAHTAAYSSGREIAPSVAHDVVHQGEIVRGGPVAAQGVSLIGHAERASIVYINAAGGELDLEFTADGAPRRLSTRPIAAPSQVAAS